MHDTPFLCAARRYTASRILDVAEGAGEIWVLHIASARVFFSYLEKLRSLFLTDVNLRAITVTPIAT